MAAALLIAGAVSIVVGCLFLCWPLAVVAAGVLAMAAGVDLSDRGSR